MLGDFRQSLRQLRKSPGFTVTAVLTLALGIGATTAIFTLIQQVMLRTLPVVKPGELWKIGDKDRCCNWGGYTQGDGDAPNDWSLFSWEAYKQFRDNTPAFTELAAFQAGNTQLGVRAAGSAEPAETRNGQFVSGNFFQTFGTVAWMGRLLTPADDHEGAPPVAVMSYHMWLQQYGADRGVVGRSYLIDGHPFTVVGVAAPSFYGAILSGWNMPGFWLPLTAEPLVDGATARLKTPNENFLDLIGRVKPGTNPRALEAQLRGELHAWQASHVADMGPQEKQTWQKGTLHLVPGGAGVDSISDDYGDGLKLLLAAAACVLLVACANLANLLLARGLKDRQQTSIRVALGASRRRLVRKALVESVTLGVLGGVAAVGVAYGGARLVVHLAFQIGGPGNWVPIDVSPSWTVLGFALGISVVTGMLFGIAPAWITSHAEPIEALRGSRGSTGTKARWPQKALVVAQAAMSLVLLSAAALLGQSLRNLQNQDFGFAVGDRYLVWTNAQLTGYPADQMPLLFRRIDERLAAIPGVHSAAAATYAPMSGDSWNDSIRVEGQPEPPPRKNTSAGWTRVTPGFFEALGNRILMGRPINEEDGPTTQNVAVINEAFAKKFFKGENPIGRHFGPDKMKYAAMYTVVGVAADMRYMAYDLDKPVGPMFYLPEAQAAHFDEASMKSGDAWSHYVSNVVLWAPGHPPNLQAQVKKAMADIDPNLVVQGVDKYDDVLAGDFQQQSMIATLTLLFGALGLVLAAVGLYGVTAYTVEQRTSEIGVRMALGADRASVVRMVLRGAFLQVGIGLALGIPAAILAGRAMAGQLYGVRPWDPAMLAVATVLLGVAAFLAAVIPARRAAGLDPVEALRNE
ncbi:MAG TPA: ABC transporter permease [Acidobacteriaceae bacterium]|jgi:predicted permease|nr:ABC transporter permease [Acidobacteriaceae bacterium]